jgi:hypothetical protein
MQTRKPPIYLLVNLPILVGGAIFLLPKLMAHYAAYKGMPLSGIPNSAGMLIALPALFMWFPLALLLSNCVLAFVPPLRTVAEDYARSSSHPGFIKSQLQLLAALAVVSLICVPIIAYGFLR